VFTTITIDKKYFLSPSDKPATIATYYIIKLQPEKTRQERSPRYE
jgi:hypothetical protein